MVDKVLISFVYSNKVQILKELLTCVVQQFFEMHRHDAVKALEIYRKSGDQVCLDSRVFLSNVHVD